MKSFIPKEAAGIVQAHKDYRRYAVILVCLAVVVALGTMFGLRMYGNAMTKEVRVFTCEAQPHQHTEDCYVEIEGEKVLNCGQADFFVHTHNLDCYDYTGDGAMFCALPEIPEHEHTDDCWQVTRTLTCDKEEAPAHTHTEACIGETKTLTCTLPETEGHTHTEACYTTQQTLTCTQPEHTHTDACYAAAGPACGLAEHTHTDACYDEAGNLTCGQEEHTHSNACYAAAGEPTCGLAEHTHTDACYTEETTLTCGQEESEGHTHTDACYTAEPGYICGLEEGPGHTHTDACYTEEKTLICDKQEAILHTHTDDCWTPVDELKEMTEDELAELDLTADDIEYLRTKDVTDEDTGEVTTLALTCGQIEVLEHIHTEANGCFHTERVGLADEDTADGETDPAERELICGLEEHTHTDACYDEAGNLICGLEEHTHTEACYAAAEGEGDTADGETAGRELICGLEEHTHTDACYDEAGNLVCGLEEHTHTEDCYAPAADGEDTATPESAESAAPVLTCGLEEHTHTAACYTDQKLLICGLEEGDSHTHSDSCYYTERVASCGKPAHTHTEACYSTAEELAKSVDGSCYSADGKLVCGKEEHIHSKACYTYETVVACGQDEVEGHVHTEDCYKEQPVLICGQTEHVHILPEGLQLSASCEVDGMLVTARYGKSANIPADAEFRVVKVDPDEERYEQRMEAASKAVQYQEDGASKPNPVALLNIGFFLPDGTEIQPATPVSISVKFLNAEEHGVTEGDSVSVVHFDDDDGTEVLTSTDVDSDATTSFDTNSFSDYVFETIRNGDPGEYGLMTIGTGDVYTDFVHNKQIDYLGDNDTYGSDADNTDTAADDAGKITDDLYRLYLDMEGRSEGVDLLLVIDRSASMTTGSPIVESETYAETDQTRSDRQVYNILYGNNSLIKKFLESNNQNQVGVVWFAGVYTGYQYPTDSGNEYTGVLTSPVNPKEGGVLQDWTGTYNQLGFNSIRSVSQFNSDQPNKSSIWKTSDPAHQGITNYAAGYFQADMMLKKIKNDGKKHVVIFLSDGLPTVYYKSYSGNITPDQWELYEEQGYNDWTKRGDGAEVTITSSSHKYIEHNNLLFDQFVERNPDVYFYPVGFKMSNNNKHGVPRTIVLQHMAEKYKANGSVLLEADDQDELEKSLRTIMFPSGVTIADDLSDYVELYGTLPDVKVTATQKEAPYTKVELWNYVGQELQLGGEGGDEIPGSVTSESIEGTPASSIIDKVTYNKSTHEIVLHFKEDYCLNSHYTYTLSFNVCLTNSAYNEFADLMGANYTVSGEQATDYGGNKTSSGQGGLRSNDKAHVHYSVDGKEGDIPYPHPVVQPWGTVFQLHKVDEQGKAVPGMTFRLERITKNGKTVASYQPRVDPLPDDTTIGDKTYYKTDASGNLSFGYLKAGTYNLYEYVQDEFTGALDEYLVATFTVEKGRITNMNTEPTGDNVNPEITVTWQDDGTPYDPTSVNCTPNETYGGEALLTVVNTHIGKALEIYKNDAAGEKLPGAVFTLEKWDAANETWVPYWKDGASKTSNAENGFVTRDTLPSGRYRLTETDAPAGYEKLEKSIEFTVDDDGIYFAEGQDPGAAVATLVEKQQEGSEETTTVMVLTVIDQPSVFKLKVAKVEGAANTSEPETTKYLPGARFALWEADETYTPLSTGSEPLWTGISGEDGIVRGEDGKEFPELKLGYYVMRELEAPDGYNLLAKDIQIHVYSQDNDDGTKTVVVEYSLDGGNSTQVAALAEGETVTYTFNVPNNGGFALPETGGKGGQMYTMGGLMLLLLAMALVYKVFVGRRHSNA